MKLHVSDSSSVHHQRVYSLYTQQWYMSYRFVDSLRAGSGCWSDKIMTLYVEERVRKCTDSVKIVVLSLWYCFCKISNLWRLVSTAVTKYTSSATTVFISFYSCYFFRLFWEAITGSSRVQKDNLNTTH